MTSLEHPGLAPVVEGEEVSVVVYARRYSSGNTAVYLGALWKMRSNITLMVMPGFAAERGVAVTGETLPSGEPIRVSLSFLRRSTEGVLWARGHAGAAVDALRVRAALL